MPCNQVEIVSFPAGLSLFRLSIILLFPSRATTEFKEFSVSAEILLFKGFQAPLKSKIKFQGF